jgi:hypothetical protein
MKLIARIKREGLSCIVKARLLTLSFFLSFGCESIMMETDQEGLNKHSKQFPPD